eukprot:CAMPEP_0183392066 /NCGR_PEP_ID=MMETSP0370-20130417/6879_1 /TAXON_ID=268820 /ORGANISM="Peridinium aciculiferum, Strain PAER-2" /LENGTH=188 /DNA_ID=CAMNT_0025571909 /DNA_START=201 /DNA_END=763 /DNA_ORIENTATION=-
MVRTRDGPGQRPPLLRACPGGCAATLVVVARPRVAQARPTPGHGHRPVLLRHDELLGGGTPGGKPNRVLIDPAGHREVAVDGIVTRPEMVGRSFLPRHWPPGVVRIIVTSRNRVVGLIEVLGEVAEVLTHIQVVARRVKIHAAGDRRELKCSGAPPHLLKITVLLLLRLLSAEVGVASCLRRHTHTRA